MRTETTELAVIEGRGLQVLVQPVNLVGHHRDLAVGRFHDHRDALIRRQLLEATNVLETYRVWPG